MVRSGPADSIAKLVGVEGLHSIHTINQLPLEMKEKVYSLLVPGRLFDMFSIDPLSFLNPGREKVVDFITPRQAGFAIIEMREHAKDKDCLFFLEIADTPLCRVEINFLIVNDTRSPRFDVDVDKEGRRTKFGAVRRNIQEEQRAMEYGLAPGQVRKGLRVMGHFIRQAGNFLGQIGHDLFVVEPLAYHNAVAFERRGFNYIRGRKKMGYINREFQPGGELFIRLDGSSPFRQPGLAKTVRGRSWAIHDGILGEPWRDVEMYLSFHRPASVNTFPGGPF